MIHEKVFRVADAGPIPIVLGGDHSITYPSAAAVARHVHPRKVGIVHFDAHADTGNEQWGSLIGHGTPMRRLIEEGWVEGRNFVQVGLRGYWPEKETVDWMREHGLRYHPMVEIEERGSEAVIADAIAEALDGPECIYLWVDIDVVDPGMAPGTGTPEAGRDAQARAAARGPADRARGGPRRDGRGRGLAAVRPERDHGDPRLSCGDRGDQRARGHASATPLTARRASGSRSWSSTRSTRCPTGCTSGSRTSRSSSRTARRAAREPPRPVPWHPAHRALVLRGRPARHDHAVPVDDRARGRRRRGCSSVVAHTVEHEVAHFFGISDDRLRELDAY